MRALCLIVLTAVSLALGGGPACAEKRVALVIGNSAYQNITRLDNPKNDAVLIASTLRDLGFALVGSTAQLDLDKPGLDRAVQSFGQSIRGADVALFYYAGHGVQVNGSNFLVPVNANPTREADVDFQMVDVNVVLRQMQGSGTKLNLVILDACRNNPFGGSGLRAAGGGLAQMRAPEGTLIAYATQPGSVAQDGEGNSPYTKALAGTVRRPGLDIFQTFNQVGLAVKRATNGAQEPWVSSSPIDGDFYFVAPQPSAASRQPDARVQDGSAPKSQAPSESSTDTRKSLESAANAGDNVAMVKLGFMFERGNGVARDLGEARKWYEKAAIAGNTTGMRNLGIVYRDGLGVEKNPAEARKWFEKSANAGNAEAMNSLGFLLQTATPPDYATARKWFEKAAAAGNTAAMVSVGFFYDKGWSVPQDDTQARYWYEKAANAGNPAGMRNLGILYRDGLGVEKNPAEARKWFEKGAVAGNPETMISLGLFLENGYGAPPDYTTARNWFEKAAGAGNAEAMRLLGLSWEINANGAVPDYAAARQWLEKAVAAGNTTAMVNLGYIHDKGYGIAQDHAAARGWYEKAAAAGNAFGMNNLGVMYRDGSGVTRDPIEARRWFEKAAGLGNSEAMVNVGYIYQTGNGVQKDSVVARQWYEKAAAAGNAVGMANLGVSYRDGMGVAQDRAAARKWFEKAAALGDEKAKAMLQRLDSPEQGNASPPPGAGSPLSGTTR